MDAATGLADLQRESRLQQMTQLLVVLGFRSGGRGGGGRATHVAAWLDGRKKRGLKKTASCLQSYRLRAKEIIRLR